MTRRVEHGESGPSLKFRESESVEVPPRRGHQVTDGRSYVAVIGVDRYRHWTTLDNAVNDARGVLRAFHAIGFEPIVELLDAAATGEAIRCLPAQLSPQLQYNDNLVVFFAGHGHTVTTKFHDGGSVHKGYLIPVDAACETRHEHTWQRVEHWLSMIAELPPRHVLVVLDACRSGIALTKDITHRGHGVLQDGTPIPPRERRSRRVLVSALDNQAAMDVGPVTGHSIFTGYLLKSLRRGEGAWPLDATSVSIGEIAEYVKRCVRQYSNDEQIPGWGWLEFDNNGDLFIPPRNATTRQETAAGSACDSRDELRSITLPVDSHPSMRSSTGETALPNLVPIAQDRHESGRLPDRSEGWTLDPVLAAALDRHREERRSGAHVLTLVAGDALAAQTSWGTWAARHGYLTLATQSVGIDAAIADLLAQTPWLRCIPDARKRLAAAARLDVQAVDADLDARGTAQRRTWIRDVASSDRHAQVSGWLLASLRDTAASVPDLTTAPVQHGELLAIACDLASPTAMLLFHPHPDDRWLEQAVVTAARLIDYLPAHSVAVTADKALVTRVLTAQRRGTAWVMARQGRVDVEPLAQRLPGRARRSTMRVLLDALARDQRTRGQFELDGKISCADGPTIEVALVSHKARIAVELDGWYHFHDPDGYSRDRIQDRRLQRAGYFVLRFPAEDVDDRLASTVEQLAIALHSRRAVRAPF